MYIISPHRIPASLEITMCGQDRKISRDQMTHIDLHTHFSPVQEWTQAATGFVDRQTSPAAAAVVFSCKLLFCEDGMNRIAKDIWRIFLLRTRLLMNRVIPLMKKPIANTFYVLVGFYDGEEEVHRC